MYNTRQHHYGTNNKDNQMQETFKTKMLKIGVNLFPVFRRMGGRVTYISGDLKEVRMKLPLNLFSRNYVGTIYGGCMFGAADGMYMVMLINLLGPEYIVWDKSGSIQFRKPGRTTLYARFIITDDRLNEIRSELDINESILKDFTVEYRDKEEVLHAVVTKTIYFRKKEKSKQPRPAGENN